MALRCFRRKAGPRSYERDVPYRKFSRSGSALLTSMGIPHDKDAVCSTVEDCAYLRCAGEHVTRVTLSGEDAVATSAWTLAELERAVRAGLFEEIDGRRAQECIGS